MSKSISFLKRVSNHTDLSESFYLSTLYLYLSLTSLHKDPDLNELVFGGSVLLFTPLKNEKSMRVKRAAR